MSELLSRLLRFKIISHVSLCFWNTHLPPGTLNMPNLPLLTHWCRNNRLGLLGDPLKIDEVFSGSTCKQGEIEAVIATGVHTFFGKAAHLVDSTNQVGHFQKVLTAIGNFCICSIVVGMVIEIIVIYPIQHRPYREGIDNLLVLLIGVIPIAMPTLLSVTMAIGSHPD